MTHDPDCKSIVGGECDCGGYEQLGTGTPHITRLSETMFTTGEVVECGDSFTMGNCIVQDFHRSGMQMPGKNYKIVGGETWIVGNRKAEGFSSVLSMPHDTEVMRFESNGNVMMHNFTTPNTNPPLQLECADWLVANNSAEDSGDHYIQWKAHDNVFAHERIPTNRHITRRKSIHIETCGFGRMPTLCKSPSVFSRIAAWWRKWMS